MSATLIALDGPLKGEAFPVGDLECSVGRDSGNTIQIPEAALSRRHCTIRSQADGGFMLTDLGSRNGTMRNGFPVTECLLCNGDEISVGPFHFLFLAG
jgi:pSer/pThr/pTyr-binding forkhead associated (FHA) protein